jgi:hypothetical protein
MMDQDWPVGGNRENVPEQQNSEATAARIHDPANGHHHNDHRDRVDSRRARN